MSRRGAVVALVLWSAVAVSGPVWAQGAPGREQELSAAQQSAGLVAVRGHKRNVKLEVGKAAGRAKLSLVIQQRA